MFFANQDDNQDLEMQMEQKSAAERWDGTSSWCVWGWISQLKTWGVSPSSLVLSTQTGIPLMP